MSELIADFFTVQFAVAIGIALMGGTIFGFAGFAAGLSMVPLLAWVYDPPTALAIVGMAVAIGAAQLLPHGIRNADWPTVGPILLAALIGVPCGTVTLLISEPETVRRVIGGLLVVFALIMLSGWTYNGPRNLMTNLFVGVSSGALSGFMSGGGSIVSSYFVSWPGSVTQTRANIYMVTYSLAVLMAGALIIAGTVSLTTVTRMLALLIPYSLGVRLGSLLVRGASHTIYRRFVLWLLMGIGLSALTL
ncbi:MAG: hypothetical protein CL569_17645 [Alphaproteobacteria bacterium]|nr:hypothetical protein [Alphaproteobacteria bacterium]|tara:strand:+ start:49 stop:792 length:744 start_codon:yes stop_codon:yes gene_type:complete